jgi:hypothetical protein
VVPKAALDSEAQTAVAPVPVISEQVVPEPVVPEPEPEPVLLPVPVDEHELTVQVPSGVSVAEQAAETPVLHLDWQAVSEQAQLALQVRSVGQAASKFASCVAHFDSTHVASALCAAVGFWHWPAAELLDELLQATAKASAEARVAVTAAAANLRVFMDKSPKSLARGKPGLVGHTAPPRAPRMSATTRRDRIDRHLRRQGRGVSPGWVTLTARRQAAWLRACGSSPARAPSFTRRGGGGGSVAPAEATGIVAGPPFTKGHNRAHLPSKYAHVRERFR